jgi:hypothetical protein
VTQTVNVLEAYADDEWMAHCEGCPDLDKTGGEFFCLHEWQCPRREKAGDDNDEKYFPF